MADAGNARTPRLALGVSPKTAPLAAHAHPLEDINMRVGQNPAKFVTQVAQPAKITVAIVTYIPFLGGYYAQSLEVLKVCLNSVWENTDLPYDLLIFDNASCAEARQFLLDAHAKGQIQFLWLSDKNIGKAGAWNLLFPSAPGDIVAYADSDVYFFPGWLSSLVQVLEAFPRVGMVTGMPLGGPPELSTSTLEWARGEPQASLQEGRIQSWEDYWRHARSLGKSEDEARQLYDEHQDILLTYRGQKMLVGAGHFQFAAYRKVLQEVVPLPSKRPMGQVMALDAAINEKGYLRLSTPQWWVQHLGNTLEGMPQVQNRQPLLVSPRQRAKPALRKWAPLRKVLFWIYHKTFDLLYRSP
ncbi:MAG: glycosyltransferase family A protein [Chloroflexota bacterium]